jgi:hypothetical protein
MQVISLVGGPAHGVVVLMPTGQLSLTIEQPGAPDRGTITGRYNATPTFSVDGYPAWEWVPDAVAESP